MKLSEELRAYVEGRRTVSPLRAAHSLSTSTGAVETVLGALPGFKVRAYRWDGRLRYAVYERITGTQGLST